MEHVQLWINLFQRLKVAYQEKYGDPVYIYKRTVETDTEKQKILGLEGALLPICVSQQTLILAFFIYLDFIEFDSNFCLVARTWNQKMFMKVCSMW